MTTQVKPIRPTQLQFETEEELLKFVNYANTKQKTSNDPGLDKLRRLMKNHKPAKERK